MIPTQDTYNVVDMLGLGQYGGGQYVEIKDIADATTKFKYHYDRQRALGRPEDEIGRWTPLAAGIQHIVWGTSNNGVGTSCNSYADIFIDHGQWAFNAICDWPYGKIFGAGTHRAYPWAGQPRGAGPTEILMFPDKYITDPNCKVNLPELGTQDNLVMTPFRSCTFGTDTWVGGYHERAGIDQIQIVGQAGRDFKKGRVIAGFMVWDGGTASKYGNVYVSDVDTAMLVTRGTPVQMDKLSGMGGNLPMVLMLGTVDCLFEFGSMECDDFPAFFMTRAQWGRESGARIEFDALKIETGVTPESRNPHTGTIIADLKGRNMLIGGIVNFAEASVNVESLIVLDDKHSDGVQQPNLIDINLGRWGVEANFLHEINGNVYGNPSGFPWDNQNFFYKRFGTKRKVQVDRDDIGPVIGVTGYKSRLGFQRWNGTAWAPAFSHAAGTPVFSYADADGSGGGTTPPTTPNPVVDSFAATPISGPAGTTFQLAWQTTNAASVSINGIGALPVDGTYTVAPSSNATYILTATNSLGVTATRTVSVTIVAATTPSFKTTFSGGGPNLVAEIGASIPPKTANNAGTFANGTITTKAGTVYNWNALRANKVVLLGYTPKGPFGSYPHITANHVVYPDGKVYYRAAFDNPADTFTGITLSVNIKMARLELPCPGGNLATVIGRPDGGNTAIATIEAMEVYL